MKKSLSFLCVSLFLFVAPQKACALSLDDAYLSGTVNDMLTGASINDATLQLFADSVLRYQTGTDNDGMYFFDQITPRPYILTTSAPGYYSVSIPVEPVGGVLTIQNVGLVQKAMESTD